MVSRLHRPLAGRGPAAASRPARAHDGRASARREGHRRATSGSARVRPFWRCSKGRASRLFPTRLARWRRRWPSRSWACGRRCATGC